MHLTVFVVSLSLRYNMYGVQLNLGSRPFSAHFLCIEPGKKI